MFKNLPTNGGDMGSIPDPGRFHVTGQLSPCATVSEPECSTAHVSQQEKSQSKSMHHNEM